MNYRPMIAVTAAALLTTLAACGNDSASSDGVAITATDSSCEVATTTLAAGKATFKVTNKGSQVTEVYIYGEQDGKYSKIVSEVENIGPGTSRDLTADLTGGTYEVACKPGQTGDGIRTKVTVAGGAASSTSPSTQAAAYDREIEIEVTATEVEGAEGLTATTGQKIEFKLENKTTGKRTLEILDPTGKVIAEFEADAGGAAETIVTLASAGKWTLKIEGGAAAVEKALTVA